MSDATFRIGQAVVASLDDGFVVEGNVIALEHYAPGQGAWEGLTVGVRDHDSREEYYFPVGVVETLE